jgi:pimeloyl-ACP methyl ester carboxylesterase
MQAADRGRQRGDAAMTRTAVLIHGACAGGWCFENFARFLQERGWTCHAPDLRFHGKPEANPDPQLAAASIADYTADMAGFIAGLDETPVLIGHSMGGLIAQQLAARGLAHSVVLLASCAPWGVLPATDDERALARALMSAGAFWTQSLQPAFEIAKSDSLASLDPQMQKRVFAKFGPESGRAMFELFFWMFDDQRTTAVEAERVRCPVLVVAGSDDKIVSAATGRRIAQRYGYQAMFHEARGRGHFLIMEEGWEDLATVCAEWMAQETAPSRRCGNG